VVQGVIDSDRFDAPGDVVDRIDLHLHSNRSDGLLEPGEVIVAAQEAGLRAVALTDHDTLAGVEEAAEAAADIGLPFVPGIEFSCYDDNGSTHLLGYFVDPGHDELAAYLANARELRVERAQKMVEKLNGLSVDVTLDDVRAQTSEHGLIARPHVARALVAGGWVKTYNEAFYRFIAAGQPAYVPTWRLSPAEGVRRIQDAGGLAILAHGGKSHSESAIRALVDAGLDGLETLHPEHGPYEVRRLRRLVEQHGLFETGGSDWHGPHDGRRGQLASQPVPYEWYVRLRDAAEERANL
jgi:predicted metal-dependent phosphoesterase TrpH